MKITPFAILAVCLAGGALADVQISQKLGVPETVLPELTLKQLAASTLAGDEIRSLEARSSNDSIFQDSFRYQPAPVRLSGRNWDHAGGHVAAWIGERVEPISVQVDSAGNYEIDLPGDIGADELIRLKARSEGQDDWRELVSVPASAPRLVGLSNSDGLVTAGEVLSLDFSVIGTAHWIATVQANGGQVASGYGEYQSLLAAVPENDVHAIATVIAAVLEDDRFELPALPPALTASCATVVDCLEDTNRFQAIRDHIDNMAPDLRADLEQLMQVDWCDTLDQRLWFLSPRPQANLNTTTQTRRLVSFEEQSRASGLTNEGAFTADCEGSDLMLELAEPLVQESFPSMLIDGVFVQVRELRTLSEIELRFVERRLEGDRIEQTLQWLLEYPDNPELSTGTQRVRTLHTVPRSESLSSFDPTDLIDGRFALAALVHEQDSQVVQAPSAGRIEFFADGTAVIIDTGENLQWAVDQNALSLWTLDQLLELTVVAHWQEMDETPFVLVERLERDSSGADWQLQAGSGFMAADLDVGPITSEGFYQDFGSRNSAHPRQTIAYELQEGIGWRLFTDPDPNSPQDIFASNSSPVYGWEPTSSGMVLRSCWFEGPVYEEPESCEFAYLRREFRLLQITDDRWYMLVNSAQWGSGAGTDLGEPPISNFTAVVFFERQSNSPPWFVSTLPAQERAALEDYYQAMDGQNWTNQGGWMGPAGTECRWAGIGCDQDLEHVTALGPFPFAPTHHGVLPPSLEQLSELEQLNLSISGPAEPFPQWLTQLQNLRRLNVANHPWTGALPASLADLTGLTHLVLTSGALAGEIPQAIGQLTQLQELSLSGNQLSGQIPDELTQLAALERLRLGANSLSGSIPENIGALQSLRELSLAGTQLSGSIPDSLGSLEQLETLLLGNNNLSGNIPASIGGLSSLITLNLGGNQLTGPIPEAFGNLSQLQNAFLSGNMLTGPLPDTLGNLDQLRNLNLSNNSISGSFPSQLISVSDLRHLNLSGNQLSGFLPNWIGELTSLQTLFLQDNAMGGQLPSQLMNLINLSDSGGLNLCGNGFVTSNTSLDAFIVSKHVGNDWQGCQQ